MHIQTYIYMVNRKPAHSIYNRAYSVNTSLVYPSNNCIKRGQGTVVNLVLLGSWELVQQLMQVIIVFKKLQQVSNSSLSMTAQQTWALRERGDSRRIKFLQYSAMTCRLALASSVVLLKMWLGLLANSFSIWSRRGVCEIRHKVYQWGTYVPQTYISVTYNTSPHFASTVLKTKSYNFHWYLWSGITSTSNQQYDPLN